MGLVTNDDIQAAVRRLAGKVVRTPLLPCPRLGEEVGGGAEILLKAENLQLTGSFKARGAQHALLARAARGRRPAGVVTFSAGNHGAAVAFAARRLGVPAAVVMRPGSLTGKVEAVRRHGGEVVFDDDLLGACERLAEQRGHEMLVPFDDPDVIAGQATVGVEILEDCPAPGLVLVPVGGGGLVSGVAAAVKATAPATRVVGVEPHTANTLTHALAAGGPAALPTPPVSLADGLTAPYAGEHTYAHVRRLVDEVVEVDEDAVAHAWWRLIDTSKLLAEPAAAVPLAALLTGRVSPAPAAPTVLVVSGGNADPRGLAELTGALARDETPRGGPSALA